MPVYQNKKAFPFPSLWQGKHFEPSETWFSSGREQQIAI